VFEDGTPVLNKDDMLITILEKLGTPNESDSLFLRDDKAKTYLSL